MCFAKDTKTDEQDSVSKVDSALNNETEDGNMSPLLRCHWIQPNQWFWLWFLTTNLQRNNPHTARWQKVNFNTSGHGHYQTNTKQSFLKKLGYSILQPCTGIGLVSASGNKIEPIGKKALNLKWGNLQMKHIYIVSKCLTHCLLLGLNFHHNFRIWTDLDKHGKLFLHQNSKPIAHASPLKSTANIESIKYQEILPYNTIIQATCEHSTQILTGIIYLRLNLHLLTAIPY